MRVLHVIPSIAASRGGPTYVVRHLARALATSGVDVEILATTIDLLPGEKELFQASVGGAVTISLTKTVGPYSLDFAPAFVPLLLARLARKRFDLVHVHTVLTFPVAIAPAICRARKIPYIVRPAGTLDHSCIESGSTKKKRLAIALAVRRNLLRAAAVHVTSEKEERELRALVPGANIARVELGIALGDEPPIAQRDSARVVGFFGRLDPQKGIELLLASMTKLDANITLEIGGGGHANYTQSLRALCTRLGLDARVTWRGPLADAQKRDFFARCDVMAFPSLHENFGIAIVEAMAAGAAIIVTPGVALAPIIAAHHAGVISLDEPGALAESIASLLADRNRRSTLGAAAHRLAIDRWSVVAMARNVRTLYDGIRNSVIV